MNLFNHQAMPGVLPIDQAKRAIQHVLNQRHQSPFLAYWIAPGSQSFALLTEAAAALFGEDLEECRVSFANAKTEDPNTYKRALERIIEMGCSCGGNEYHPCAYCIAREAIGGGQ